MFSLEDGEIKHFLAKNGLRLVEHLDNEEIERKFLMKKDGSILGQITRHFRFVLAGS